MITLTRGEAQNVLNLLILWLDEQEEPDTETAIETLRVKLSEPEPEPVGWMSFNANGEEDDIWYVEPKNDLPEGWTYKPLYAAPPQREWVGLTDMEIVGIATLNQGSDFSFARAIEAKLKEKNA